MRIFIVLVCLLFAAKSVKSADYRVVGRTPTQLVFDKNGELELVQRPKIIKRLHDYISKRTTCNRPLEMAELLAATDHPKVMAGIYYAEGSYNGEKVGADGEQGPFQLMSEHIPANYNPRDFPQNVKLAADLLAEKIRENGSLREGVRAYNGSKHNPKAQAYREKVFREAAKV